MIHMLDRTLEFLATREAEPETGAIDRLKAVARWTMQVQLAGEMPALPAQNSSLRTALMCNKVYLDRLMVVSDKLGEWITAAQAAGTFDPKLPPELILYTLFARACDPVLSVVKASGQHADEQIIEWLVGTTSTDSVTRPRVKPSARQAGRPPQQRPRAGRACTLDRHSPRVVHHGCAGGLLRLVPAATWAVIRYSGTWSQANYLEHSDELTTALQAAGVATQGGQQ
jgi:hypothetical protein